MGELSQNLSEGIPMFFQLETEKQVYECSRPIHGNNLKGDRGRQIRLGNTELIGTQLRKTQLPGARRVLTQTLQTSHTQASQAIRLISQEMLKTQRDLVLTAAQRSHDILGSLLGRCWKSLVPQRKVSNGPNP